MGILTREQEGRSYPGPHNLALAIERIKIALSDKEEYLLHVPILKRRFELILTKQDLDIALIAALKTTIEDPGIVSSQVDAVFMTGGASLVSLVRQSILSNLPKAKLVDGDKFGIVATGLTLIAAQTFGEQAIKGQY